MNDSVFYIPSESPSIVHAAKLLQKTYSIVDHPSPEITHLLLDVPTNKIPKQLLDQLPVNITIIGGNLPDWLKSAYRCFDLLEDPFYLSHNASITAECALSIASDKLPITFRDSNILILGWGRIGKELARLLSAYHANASVYSRTDHHLAEISLLGLQPIDMLNELAQYDLIINTAPSLLIPSEKASMCINALKIDLASIPGIDAADVIHARGLPRKYKPLTSGRLIAETIIRKIKEEAL